MTLKEVLTKPLTGIDSIWGDSMKISLFIGGISGGGAEHVVCDLASYLCERCYDVEILTVSEVPDNYLLHSNVHRSSLSKKSDSKNRIIRVLTKMFRLWRHISKSKTDLYVVFLPETIHALMFFRKLIKAPIVISERGDPSSYNPKLLKMVLNDAKKADGVVFQTKMVEKYYKDRVPITENIEIIPNAITSEKVLSFKNKKEKT